MKKLLFNLRKFIMNEKNKLMIFAYRIIYSRYFYKNIPLLSFKGEKKIFFIAPHPDDEMIGAFGSIIENIKKGAEVYILYCSQGLTEEEKTIRKQEALKACQLMKANPLFLEWPVKSFFSYQKKAVEELAEAIKQIEPEAIYLPFPIDQNPDHVAVNYFLYEVIEKYFKKEYFRLIFYPVISSLTPDVANRAIDVTNYLKMKRDILINVYKSQNDVLDMEKFLVINRMQGIHTKSQAAELYAELDFSKWASLLEAIRKLPSYYLPVPKEVLFSWKNPLKKFFRLAEKHKRICKFLGEHYTILLISLDEQKKIGGKQHSINLLHKGFMERGHNIIFVDGSLNPLFDYFCRGFAKLFYFLNRSLATNLGATLRAFIIGLKTIKQARKADIIQTHDFFSAEPVLFFFRCLNIKTPIITVVHGQNGLTLESIANGFLCPESLYTKQLFKREQKVYKAVDQIITVSKFTKIKLCEKFNLPIESIQPIYEGRPLPGTIEESEASIRKELGVSVSSFVVTCVATFRPVKGIDILIAAAPMVLQKMPNAIFLIVGDGFLRSKLEEQISRLKLNDFIKLLGFRKDVYRILKITDLYVQPSRNENLCGATLEAMSMGLPVIATAVGGLMEIVDDGKTGLLISSENPEALASAIIYLAENPLLRDTMGRLGKEKFENQFTIEKMVINYENLYNKIVLRAGTKKWNG
jgi:glycosyltransferase involved in cell wall biosynthesis/LmbE family N-acetylglucosaminyl deacetylase